MKLSKTKSISRIKASQDTLYSLCHVMYYVSGILLFVTVISGLVLSSSSTHADTTTTRGSTVSVTVNNACTMKGGSDGTATGNSVYSATVDPGTTKEITGSKLTTSLRIY